MNDTSAPQVSAPPESALLKAAYKASGVRAADLAVATGMSVGSVHVAMSGIRYRDGQARVAVPPDATLIKLASVLRVAPDALREVGRTRAAELLEWALREQAETPTTFASDQEAQAALAGRAALARQVLALFSTAELRAELERRGDLDREELEREEFTREVRDAAMAEISDLAAT